MSLFHDDVLALDRRVAGGGPVQGTLALAEPPIVPPPPPRRREPVVAPDWVRLEHWARRYCQVAVDVVTGDRPAAQVLRWSTPEVFAALSERAALVARAGGPSAGRRPARLRPKVISVRACYPDPDVAEVSAHVRQGHRSRAVALRFERAEDRWVCTVLQFAPLAPDGPEAPEGSGR